MRFVKLGKLFYPRDDKADEFLKTFPNSRGSRKSLTVPQISILKDLGVHLQIEKQGDRNARDDD